jgi:uncharacterized protein
VKANEETLSLSGSLSGELASEPSGGLAGVDTRADTLRREIGVLAALLPQAMSVEQIAQALLPLAEAIRAAKAEGQAMGVAMKHLKASGAAVEAADVQRAVQRLRE